MCKCLASDEKMQKTKRWSTKTIIDKEEKKEIALQITNQANPRFHIGTRLTD